MDFLCYTLQVKQMDDMHPEFEPDLLIHFVTEVAKALAAISGKVKVMLRGDQLAARATETLQVSAICTVINNEPTPASFG